MTNKEKAEVYREAAAFLQKDGWMIPTEKLKAEADRIDPSEIDACDAKRVAEAYRVVG